MVVAISVLSELVMALMVMYSIPMLGERINQVKRINLITSLLLPVVITICFNVFFNVPYTEVRVTFLVLNYFKYIVSSAILYKTINVKMICLTFIMYLFCDICKIGISSVIPEEYSTLTLPSELLLLFVRIAVMALLLLFKRKCQKNYYNTILTILPNYIYILVLIDLFLSEGLIATVNFKFSDTHNKDMMIKGLTVPLVLSVFVTLVSLLFSVVSKEYYSDINKLLEKQIKNQISYYQDREKTYTEIRRFKHDYTNHINCIRSMIKAERYDEISEYLGEITNMFPSNKLLFNTGNFISDAILSDKQNSVKAENITIQFDGTIPTSINETDLCIILGNAIDNAIEASRVPTGEKIISVYGGFSHSYFILTVTNPTDNAASSNGSLPFTTKANKSEHGFGLLNIKSVVDKYNGYMKIDNKDNTFTLSLTFNSIISEYVKS